MGTHTGSTSIGLRYVDNSSMGTLAGSTSYWVEAG